MLINENSRLCLQREANGNGMIQMPCDGGADQQFEFVSSGFLQGERLRRRGTNQCLRRLSSQSQTILSGSCSNTASRRWFKDFL